jgi:hypothetical protein
MTGTDHIMLFDGYDFANRTAVWPWPHPWPPWENLVVVTGIQTGVQALVSSEGMKELAQKARVMGCCVEEMYHQTAYVLCSHSDLPESVALDPESCLFRSARYAKASS